MACKASHVQDNSVVERRLRPIYGKISINSFVKLRNYLYD